MKSEGFSSGPAESKRSAHLRRQRLQLLCGSLTRTPFGVAIAIAFVVYTAWGHVSLWLIGAWALLLVAILLARMPYALHLVSSPPADPEPALRHMMWFAVAHGLMIGAAAVVFFPQLPLEGQALLTMVLVCWTGGGVATAAAHPPSFHAFVVPALLPLALLWALPGQPDQIAIGVMIVLFGVIQVLFVRDNERVVQESFDIRYENEQLVRQLQVASQHKSTFLASMSHELRTPLNAILGFNEMLLGKIYGEVPVSMQEPLEDIQKSGKHLLRLINNVLDLAKIEAGRMELSLSDYSVQDTVESVRATLRPLAAEKGIDFVAEVSADIPLAYGDAGRITQCLLNLAGNSLKFTKAGKVEISVARDDGLLRYRVADTGIGIPAEQLDVVFSEFRQTDLTIASEYGGTGLGLSITKNFIEMHGGRIWVESTLGKGSTFIFEIPLRARQVTAQAPA